MPVYSVHIISTISGKILLNRYYQSLTSSSLSSTNYEQQLSKELDRYHHKFRNSSTHSKRYTYNISQPSTSTSSSSSSSSIPLSDIYIVFQAIQDIVIIVSGTDDIDEIILSSILDSLSSLLMVLFDQKLIESSFSNADSFTKLLLCLDEMFPQGIIETLDVDRVRQLIKLKF